MEYISTNKSAVTVEQMIKILSQYDKDTPMYIMDDKQLWLDKHFPIIRQQDRILTFENISKADSIVEYCAGHRIDLKDVVYVDDVLAFLREAERKGIKSYHISSFLDWDYSDDYFSLKDTDLYPLESTDVLFDIHNG